MVWQIPPIQRCMVCSRLFWIKSSWWLGFIRWGIPEYCSRKCADADELDWLDNTRQMLARPQIGLPGAPT